MENHGLEQLDTIGKVVLHGDSGDPGEALDFGVELTKHHRPQS